MISRRARNTLAIGAAVLLLGFAAPSAARFAIRQLAPPSLSPAGNLSTLVLDHHGELLRPFLTNDGKWRLPVNVEAIDQRFLALLIAYEDRRFYSHSGVDALAMIRAGFQRLWRGRVVSGGSTITMQLARLLEPRPERSLTAKLHQMLHALALEARLSKQDILRLYLTLAPYGGNLEGLRTASLAYFGKEPRRLSIGETALLVALPQNPEARRPDQAGNAARQARERVLRRLERLGAVSRADVAAAADEVIPASRRPIPLHAAHLAERLMSSTLGSQQIVTTIDKPLQMSLEALIAERVASLGPKLSAAIIVLDNGSGALRAHVASAGYLDRTRAGAVDMTLALRSPGSTLKPFIYALAFDEGLAHPETLVSDEPQRYGAYAPVNFDRGHQGTLSVRKALQQSLNLPAIEFLERLTPQRFLSRLNAAGATTILPNGTVPGLAVGLGGLGMSLSDLARLYSGLARGGTTIAFRSQASDPVIEQRLSDPLAAFYVADILRQAPPPDGMLGGQFAFKTGTSYGFRDAWAVGFTRQTTIAVWVGRPDNGAVSGLTGRGVAAPLLFDAFARLPRAGDLPAPPDGALSVTNASLPPPLRAFGQAAYRFSQSHGGTLGQARLSVAFPPDGSRLERNPDEPILLKGAGGMPPLQWFVDGVPLPGDDIRRSAEWLPRGPGFVRISVNDRSGASASVRIRLD
ncbi:MAG: penicillin-binding protein 1C [Hyphomicrobiales bacterium]|nr:penicillin-binding protein 1C [Hyphomicrobiales bacterium]OQW80991.1 MAG: penicillin-binding protein 1C [Proteobacteria bacterium ST_bin15]